MSENTLNVQQPSGAVQTTGHAWDGDLQEYNNPLPRWWLWCFYGTAVFSVLYWFIYPSWPVGQTWIKGFGTVSYTIADKVTGKEKEQEHRWNTRALLLEDLGDAANDKQRKDMLAKVQAASYDQIVNQTPTTIGTPGNPNPPNAQNPTNPTFTNIANGLNTGASLAALTHWDSMSDLQRASALTRFAGSATQWATGSTTSGLNDLAGYLNLAQSIQSGTVQRWSPANRMAQIHAISDGMANPITSSSCGTVGPATSSRAASSIPALSSGRQAA